MIFFQYTFFIELLAFTLDSESEVFDIIMDLITLGEKLLKLAKIVLDERDKKELVECAQKLLAYNEVLVSGSETLVRPP